jgi:hypothetical protein
MLEPLPGPVEAGLSRLGLELDSDEARAVVSRIRFVSDAAPDTPRRLRSGPRHTPRRPPPGPRRIPSEAHRASRALTARRCGLRAGRCSHVTDCGADVAWDPAHRPAVYRLEIAGPLAPASPPHSPARTRPADPKPAHAHAGHVPAIGSGPGVEEAGAGEGFRVAYRGPECGFAARGLAPGRRYRVRVRAELDGARGAGDAGAGADSDEAATAHSRWARPEAEFETALRQPLRYARH